MTALAMPSVKQKLYIQSWTCHLSTLVSQSKHPTQLEDTNELFGDDVPVINAPVNLTVEGESKDGETRQLKETETPVAN